MPELAPCLFRVGNALGEIDATAGEPVELPLQPLDGNAVLTPLGGSVGMNEEAIDVLVGRVDESDDFLESSRRFRRSKPPFRGARLRGRDRGIAHASGFLELSFSW